MANTGYVLSHDDREDSANGGDYRYVGGMTSWASSESEADWIQDGGSRWFEIFSWFTNEPDATYYMTHPYEADYWFDWDSMDLVLFQWEPEQDDDISNTSVDADINGSVSPSLGPFSLNLASVQFESSGNVDFEDTTTTCHWNIALSQFEDFPTNQDQSHGVRANIGDGSSKGAHYPLAWDSSYSIAYRDTSQDTNPIVDVQTVKIQGSQSIYVE